MSFSGILKRVWALLDPVQKHAVRRTAASSTVLGLLEVAGLFLAYPAILLLVSSSNGTFHVLGRTLQVDNSLLPALLVAAIVVLVVKSVVAVFLIRRQLLQLFLAEAGTAVSITERHLRGDYSAHAGKNAASLLWLAEGAVAALFANAVIPMVTILSELVQGFAVILALLVIAPLEALICGTFFIAMMGGFYIWSSRRAVVAGATQMTSYQAASGSLLDISRGFKEIRLRKVEHVFLEQFTTARRTLADSRAVLEFLSQVPRFVLEASLMIATAALAGLLLATMPRAQATATLGLFVIAGIRLLPAFSRIVAGLNRLKSVGEALDMLEADALLGTQAPLRETTDSAVRSAQGPAAVEVRDVWYSYPGAAESPILRGASLKIAPGERIAIVGASGAGKTTLVNLILGLMTPSRGAVLLNGVEVDDLWRHVDVGYVAQDPYLLAGSLNSNIRFGADEGLPVEPLIAKVDLTDLVSSLPQGLATPLGEGANRISGGERQRLALARALYVAPQLLVMDEGTSSLDDQTEYLIDMALQGHIGCTQIIIAHRMNTVRRCDRVAVLVEGRIEVGKFDAMAAANSHLRALLAAGARG